MAEISMVAIMASVILVKNHERENVTQLTSF
jgi:hypothetical protein